MRIKDIREKFARENPESYSQISADLAFQIGKRIEVARALKNMTQSELAQEVGTRQSSISRVESGSSLPSLSFLQKIAKAFNTHLVPPEFAFMRNFSTQRVSYTADYSETKDDKDVRSPYYPNAEIKKDHIILG